MKRIYSGEEIRACIAKSGYHAVLNAMDIDFYLIKYEKGELLSSPFEDESLFQIVEQGSINIYFIRDDGTRYALANGACAIVFLHAVPLIVLDFPTILRHGCVCEKHTISKGASQHE